MRQTSQRFTALVTAGFCSAAIGAEVPVPMDRLSAATVEGRDATPAAVSIELREGVVASLLAGRTTVSSVVPAGQGLDADPIEVTSSVGRIEGGGSYILSRAGDAVWGALWTADGAFELHGVGSTDNAGRPLAEVVPIARNLPACMTGAEEQLIEGVESSVAPRAVDTTARVLLALGPNVASQLPNDATKAAFAANAIASANEAYVNSQIAPFQLELAAYVLVDTPSGAGGSELLQYSTGVNDGYLDELHTLRDAYEADLVPLIVDISSFCGVAWLAPDAPDYSGFSVTDYDCAIGNLTFAHELGHNLGAAHDPDNAGGSYFPYGYGHRWNSDQYRSVMSYSPGSRVPYFSNPDVSVFGGVTGIEGQRDNARLINNTQGLIADFRLGTPDATDCDGSGEPDVIEIALGHVRDDDGNGVPDSCDIAAGAADCNGNGLLDAYETRPTEFATSLPIGPAGAGSTASATMSGLPEPDGDVTMEIVAYGDLGEGSETLTVDLDGGEWFDVFGESHPGDCYAPRVTESFTLSAAQFNALRDGPGVEVEVSGTPDVNPTLCSAPTAVTVRFRYRTFNDAIDADRDGVIDACAGPCSFADCDGSGTLNVDDIDCFVAAFLTSDLAGADCDGNGTLNVDDIDCFVASFLAGCP